MVKTDQRISGENAGSLGLKLVGWGEGALAIYDTGQT